jgi:hypothetical protein
VEGTAYEVDPNLAGETVLLLWGLFDNELYVEYEGNRSGPYYPVSGPIPLHRYRSFKKTKTDEKADRIRQLADQLGLPIAALAGEPNVHLIESAPSIELPHQPFDAKVDEVCYPTVIAAKLAIADEIGKPLAKLSEDDRLFINAVLADTLVCSSVLTRIREYIRNNKIKGEKHAG